MRVQTIDHTLEKLRGDNLGDSHTCELMKEIVVILASSTQCQAIGAVPPFNSSGSLTHFGIKLYKQLQGIIYWEVLRTLLVQGNQSGCDFKWNALT